MALSEKLQYLISVDAAGAVKGFQSVGKAADKELGGAEKRMDKLGGSMVKFGAGALAAAGVIGTGLFKAANAFQDLAIESGKFADATGLAVDQASRWIEVAGDMGIESATVEASLNKMNKTLGATPQLFEKYGVEVAKAADGTTDVNQTFLNVADRLNAIKDPAERAAAATALLGRGWTGMADMIAAGSDSLKASLDSVSDAKVISPEEEQRAKDYRAAMDQLSDSLEDLVINIGQGAVPVLSTLASVVASGVEAFGQLNAITGGAAGTMATFGAAGLAVVGVSSMVIGKAIQMAEGFAKMGKAGKAATVAMGALAVVAAAYAYHAQRAAERAADVANAIENLSSVADDAVLNEFATALTNNAIAGESVAAVLDQMARDNLPGFRRAIQLGTESGDLNTAMLDEMNAAIVRNDERIAQLAKTTADHGDAMDDATRSTARLSGATRKSKEALEGAATAAAEMDREVSALTESIDDEQAWLNMLDSLDAYKAKMEDATATDREKRQAGLDVQEELIGRLQAIKNLPAKQQTEILTLINEGAYEAAAWKIGELTSARNVRIGFKVGDIPRLPGQKYASGTNSAKRGLALVGEEGPELVEMAGGERVHTAAATAAMAGTGGALGGGGGTTVTNNITVTVPVGANQSEVGRNVANALAEYYANGGRRP